MNKKFCVQRTKILRVVRKKRRSMRPSKPTLRCSNVVSVSRGHWTQEINQRNHLESIGKQLGVRQLDDWYKVSAKEVKKQTPFIKSYYKGSLFETLKHLYPQHNWDPLHFNRAPQRYWSDINNQKQHIEHVALQLEVKNLDDWYKVSSSTLRKKVTFLSYYDNSMVKMLKTLYPDHDWDPTRFYKAPQHFWSDEKNQRNWMDRIGVELGVKELDDWYNVDSDEVRRRAPFIHDYYNNSVFRALKKIYPEHDWDPTRFFTSMPRTYWNSKRNQREMMERLARELGVSELSDWYSAPSDVTRRISFIRKLYNNSLMSTLKALYPTHEWDPFQFSTREKGFWSKKKNQRVFLDKIAPEFGVKTLDDWYRVSSTEISKKVPFITNYYNRSIYKALKNIYPHHKWDPLQFETQTPRNFWSDESTKKKFHSMFMKWKKQYNITEYKDWYLLPPQQKKLFQRATKGIFGSVTKMLTEWFPETTWTAEVQASNPERDLQTLVEIAADVQVHPKIGEYSFDIYVPEWKVAIEYQGGQHFQKSWKSGDIENQLQRDNDKREFCERNGISLVTINHQWNGGWSQVRATIRQLRPDLLVRPERENEGNIFPENLTLEEVSSVIRGKKFFKRIEWEDFISFDYDNSKFPMSQFKKVFKDPNTAVDEHFKRKRQIYRECRGLKFSKKGELLSRPLHKFFNLNEIPELKMSSINFDDIELVLEKYDGIMVSPIKINDTIKFVTRAGSVDPNVSRYVSKTNHAAFAEYILSKGKTPVFEFVSKNQIQFVVNYKEQSLILIAIRDNITGRYSSYEELKEEAAAFEIAIPKEWPIPKNAQKLELMKSLIGIEGFVFRMKDGSMFKWKTDWWRAHRHRRRNPSLLLKSTIE